MTTDPRFMRPVYARLRRLCLARSRVTEETAWDHPTFLAGTKMFCAFEVVRARPSVAFRLPPSTIARLVRRTHFFATPYGRGAWVSRWLDVDIDWREMAALVTDSHEHALTAAPVRARRRSAP